jgi:nucleoside-diphosphate-sugar epimerase
LSPASPKSGAAPGVFVSKDRTTNSIDREAGMPVWLITGGSGFLGRHLLARLARRDPDDIEIRAVGRWKPPEWHAETFRQVDLDLDGPLARVVDEVRPSLVFHLAGRTPPASNDVYYRINLLNTLRLLDTLRARGQACRVVLVGSAAELGPVPVEDLPVDEDHPCRPADAYGLSKWLATVAGLAASPPLEVVVARVFNPVGPGLPTSQALGRFAEALASGSGPLRLKVGDLEARRDFVDVRDVARALIGLAKNGQPGQVYHIGTGQSRRVGDGLDRLIEWSGREVEVSADPSLSRGHGPSDSRADLRKVVEHVGWRPEISWERSLRDLWDHALERSRAGLTGNRPPV